MYMYEYTYKYIHMYMYMCTHLWQVHSVQERGPIKKQGPYALHASCLLGVPFVGSPALAFYAM